MSMKKVIIVMNAKSVLNKQKLIGKKDGTSITQKDIKKGGEIYENI
jgi:hypothetical protein